MLFSSSSSVDRLSSRFSWSNTLKDSSICLSSTRCSTTTSSTIDFRFPSSESSTPTEQPHINKSSSRSRLSSAILNINPCTLPAISPRKSRKGFFFRKLIGATWKSSGHSNAIASTAHRNSFLRNPLIKKSKKAKAAYATPSTAVTTSISPLEPPIEFEPASEFGLYHAAATFKFAVSIGGAINIPGIKAVAKIASKIVNIVQVKRMKANSEACLFIAVQACQLIKALVEGSQTNAAALDDILASHIKDFINHMKTIQGILTKIQARTQRQRVSHNNEEAGDIATCWELLTRCTKLFQVRSILRLTIP